MSLPTSVSKYLTFRQMTYSEKILADGYSVRLGKVAKNGPGAWTDHSRAEIVCVAGAEPYGSRAAYVKREIAAITYSVWAPLVGVSQEVQEVFDALEAVRVGSVSCDGMDFSGGAVLFRQAVKSDVERNAFSIEDLSTELDVSILWARTAGWAYSGTFSDDEMLFIDASVREILGEEVVNMMADILSEAVTVQPVPSKLGARDADPQRLLELAVAWTELFSQSNDGEGGAGQDSEGEEGSSSPESEGDAGDGKGGSERDSEGGSERDSEGGSSLSEADKSALRSAAEEIVGLPERRPIGAADVTSPDEAVREVTKNRKTRDKAWVTQYLPTVECQTAAKNLTRIFEETCLPSVGRELIPSEAPPGRLRGREAVRAAADRSAGRMTEATPWTRTRRIRQAHKPVRIGVLVDTSGSMGWAEEVIAEFSWAVSVAGNRIGARVAALSYGDYVSPIVLPSEIPEKVVRYPANGGTEMYDPAAAAMDSYLGLSQNDGAFKLVFNVTDGHYVAPGMTAKSNYWARQWASGGTTTVWIGNDASEYRRLRHDWPAGSAIVPRNSDLMTSVQDLIPILTRSLADLGG